MQSWALSICGAMVGGGIFSLLIPNGNMKRVMAFTINLFFVCALVSPIITKAPKIDIPSYISSVTENKDLKNLVKYQSVDLATYNLKVGIQNVIKQNGYKIENLDIEINTESQETKITVALNEESRQNERAISSLIQSETGITPKVVYKDG